jgi:Zn-dependent protease
MSSYGDDRDPLFDPLRDQEYTERDYRPIHPEPAWRSLARKLGGPIIAAAVLIAKFGFAAFKFLSIFVAVGGYALIWGWKFAIGAVLMILVHEMGHYVEAKRQGANPSLPVFIPFLGAYVALRDARLTPWQHALIAIAGPIAGGLGAFGAAIAGVAYDSDLWRAIAYWGFLINLFNMIPIGFLDGGAIARSFRVLRLGGAPGRATVVGVAYVALAALLVYGMYATHVAQDRL